MITAADTNVLFDILLRDPDHGPRALESVREAARRDSIIIGEVVYAELAAGFPDASDLDPFLHQLRVQLVAAERPALQAAGRAWMAYSRRARTGILCADCGSSNRPTCRKCGSSLRGKQHLLADFLIGGHALMHADRLLTRDRRHFKRYFPGLTLLHP